jgi:chromosome segregation ATPase
LPTLQQDDSQAPAKVEYCSDDGFMRNSEDILSLQLELDIIKTILVEEIKARAEIEVRTSALGDELKAANLHILEAYRQKEDAEKELNSARSVVDALESQQIILINKLDELKKKLKRMQASLEKACNLNTRYQQDQTSRSSAEQEMDEVRRQAEMETAEVIISLTEELSSVRQQLHATEKNELLAKQSLGEIDRIELLLDESIKTLVQKEVLEHNYVSLLRGMEEKISQLGSQLDQSDRCYKVRLKELEIKMQEVDDKASASLISWNEEREVTVRKAIRLAPLKFWSFKEFCFFL